MKYLVIIKKWDNNKGKQVEEVAGGFNEWFNAMLFKKAYDNHYCTNAKVIDVTELTDSLKEV